MKKMLKQTLLFSLFSLVLLSSCITVKRIAKKDARDNQFSQDLIQWMAIVHPQKIDTQVIITADTSPWILDTGQLKLRELLDTPLDSLKVDTLNDYTPVSHDSSYSDSIIQLGGTLTDSVIIVDAQGVMWKKKIGVGNQFWQGSSGKVTKLKTPPCPVTDTIKYYREIHDTVRITVLNQTQLNALDTLIVHQASSISGLQLSLANEKNTALKRLIWIIGMGIVLGLLGYFTLKPKITTLLARRKEL